MSEPREEDEIEMTDNEVGEYDQDITSPLHFLLFNSFKNSSPLSFNVLLTKKLFIVEILCKPSITIHFPGSLTSK
jgi:hypothetical protein